MQKRTQKWTVVIIIAIICITLIGSSFVALFQPDPEKSAEVQNQQVLENEYKARKQTVEILTAKVQEDPENTEKLSQLADAYYNKAQVTAQTNMNEHQEDLQKAVEMYQKVLAKKEDNVASLKLATAAFLLGESELAEKTYTDLLQKEPENIEALYGYGMYLFYEKEDHKSAEEHWQKALSLTKDEQLRQPLEQMIARAQGIVDTGADEQQKNK